MKRSEMIEILKKYNDMSLGGFSELIHDSYYDILLTVIEGAGMMPPEYDAGEDGSFNRVYKREWEPEDEA